MVKDLLKTLKALSWMRWEKALVDIRKIDPEYARAMDRVVEYEQMYEEMELRPEDKAAIDGLLKALDDVEECEVNLAYLVGMSDCLLILDSLQLFQL